MISRREFLAASAAASAITIASGLGRLGKVAAQQKLTQADITRFDPLGTVTILHVTDIHAQLMPLHFREPSINLGVGDAKGKPPHLTDRAFREFYKIRDGSADAFALTADDFSSLAKTYGRMGGMDRVATLIKAVRGERGEANVLLLDGGDTWQGSWSALQTKGQDMVDACKLLGVDVMTGHWDFTYGEARIKKIVEGDFAGKVDFVAQNVKTSDFGDAVFKPYVIKEMNGVRVAIIGQAFPYTPIANPAWLTPNWTFGIRESEMQETVNDARAKGAQAVVLLSHNGMDVDLKMASRVSGIDAILGGHTHDGVPVPVIVKNPGGQTIVTNAGSNGKFLGVLDLDVKGKAVVGFKYRLLPVFSNLLAADKDMTALITKIREPHLAKLTEKLATTEGTLYRRGNFNGTFDQVILSALMEVRGADIAFSPGFRWGTSLLPGQSITREHLMDQTAITYPWTTLTDMRGDMIKTILEDVGDNLFNPDPYYQQGGDMVRTGGLTYTCEPGARMGSRIQDMRLNGKLIEADKTYKVAGWAPVAEASKNAGPPIWEVVEIYLKAKKVIKPVKPNTPQLIGVAGNPGLSV